MTQDNQAPSPALTDEELDRLVELEKKATGGPWDERNGLIRAVVDDDVCCPLFESRTPVELGKGRSYDKRFADAWSQEWANAKLIVALRNSFTALVERVKRAEARAALAERIVACFEYHRNDFITCDACHHQAVGSLGDELDVYLMTADERAAFAANEKVYFDDEQDAQLSALQSKLEMARGALEPFAESLVAQTDVRSYSQDWRDETDDTVVFIDTSSQRKNLPPLSADGTLAVGDFRRARAILSQLEASDGR